MAGKHRGVIRGQLGTTGDHVSAILFLSYFSTALRPFINFGLKFQKTAFLRGTCGCFGHSSIRSRKHRKGAIFHRGQYDYFLLKKKKDKSIVSSWLLQIITTFKYLFLHFIIFQSPYLSYVNTATYLFIVKKKYIYIYGSYSFFYATP